MSSRVGLLSSHGRDGDHRDTGFGAQAIGHRLQIELEPESGLLRVTDEISLESLTPEQGVEFLLNAALEIVESRPAVERVPVGEVAGFYGINGTSIELSGDIELARYRLLESPAEGWLEIVYAGEFDFGLSAQKEEYTRGFRETAGIVGEEGVVSGGQRLLVSELWRSTPGRSRWGYGMPEDWHVISQGNGDFAGRRGPRPLVVGWCQDEIYVVGGPLVAYRRRPARSARWSSCARLTMRWRPST